jgi:hypothetical protein
MKMAITAALVTLVLVPAAAAQTTSTSVPTTTVSAPRPPDAFLSSNSGEVKGEIQNFCWIEGSLNICADRFQPIDPASALIAQPGESLTLRFDRPISPTRIRVFRSNVPAFPFPSENAFDVPAGNPTQFTLNLPPGTYFLGISTNWAQGDATYVFEVNVTGAPTTTSLPPPTTTTTTTLPPTTTTTRPATTTTSAPTTCGGRTATIVGTAGADTIFGTPGQAVILAGAGGDDIQGLGGDDIICGGAGNDRLLGGDGNDQLFGDARSDQLFGGNGNDTLDGGTEPDQCHGEAGTDAAFACEVITGLP